MQRFWLQLVLVLGIIVLLAACSGDWYMGDDYGYYDSGCPRHRSYGPLNCNNCHW